MREASPTASSILGSITLLWKSRKSSIFPSIWRTLHFQGEFSTRGFFLTKTYSCDETVRAISASPGAATACT